MKNKVIEVLDLEHGKRVIEYWKSQGVDTEGLDGGNTKERGSKVRYYGVINGYFCCYSIDSVKDANAEIIELPEEKTFPRVMLVSCGEIVWYQAVVEGMRGGYAFATNRHSSVEEYESALKRGDSVPFYLWKYYKELSDRYKVSKSEIAEKFNIPLDKLEIVD